MVYLVFGAGLLALFFGGEFLVRGAVGIARRYHVPPLVIGLTIVGFGTSMPELLVSLQAALAGTPAIAVGNVLGSNIANILLILGLSSLIAPVGMRLGDLPRDFAVMIGATLLLWALMWGGLLTRVEGFLLLAGLVAYLALCLRDKAEPEPEGAHVPPLLQSLLAALGGLATLMLGAKFLVSSATEIARDYGISEAVIGLTIVAVGTSLPELATSLVAAFRRQADIAVGNILGSNIFNILGILGATAAVTPVPIDPRFVGLDMGLVLAASIALLALAAAAGRIGRRAGGGLLIAYGSYLALMG
ncbi:calcium/sodium antiporter [Ostreiculturibacter nitratireducens]|uniref:calcium/sodium antiporter n=1 Tax=Ostreiculturibacter nitratireducens TaxID=3075226 RepID=UPI0031B63D88